MKFKKGPVVSLVDGDVVCQKCAAMHDRNLWDVCSNYDQHLAERKLETDIYDLPVDNINFQESLNPEKYDEAFLGANEYDDHPELKYDDPFPNEVDKCAGCAHRS